jgi:hypothetical protein
MTKSTCFTGSRLADQSLIPATFQSFRRCPARPDYIELCFETEDGLWTWCFRDPRELSNFECGSGRTLALTVGPYGAQARCVEDNELGFAVPTSEALPIILGGSPTYVARKLVERGW